jgi:hypothetical protein
MNILDLADTALPKQNSVQVDLEAVGALAEALKVTVHGGVFLGSLELANQNIV